MKNKMFLLFFFLITINIFYAQNNPQIASLDVKVADINNPINRTEYNTDNEGNVIYSVYLNTISDLFKNSTNNDLNEGTVKFSSLTINSEKENDSETFWQYSPTIVSDSLIQYYSDINLSNEKLRMTLDYKVKEKEKKIISKSIKTNKIILRASDFEMVSESKIKLVLTSDNKSFKNLEISDIKVFRHNTNEQIAYKYLENQNLIRYDNKIEILLGIFSSDDKFIYKKYDIVVKTKKQEEIVIKERLLSKIKKFNIEKINQLSIDMALEKITNIGNDSFKLQISHLLDENYELDEIRVDVQFIKLPVELNKKVPKNTYPFVFEDTKIGVTGEINLPSDGFYELLIDGDVKDNEGITIPLDVKGKKYFFKKDTRVIVKSLQFNYGEKRANVSFKLDKDISNDLVIGKINNSNKRKVIANFNEETKVYVIETDISKINSNKYETLNILVAGNKIFDFSFKVVQSEKIKKKIQESIDEVIKNKSNVKDISKLRPKKINTILKNNKELIAKKVKNKFKNDILSQDSPFKSQDDIFLKEFEKYINTEIDNIANRHLKKLDDKEFWDTTVGKITKGLGSLALRYLGIIIT